MVVSTNMTVRLTLMMASKKKAWHRDFDILKYKYLFPLGREGGGSNPYLEVDSSVSNNVE